MIVRLLIVMVAMAAGFGVLKLAFSALCWTVGHNSLEMVWGGWATVVLTCAVGIEAFASTARVGR